jgi:hypothetical protein
VYAVPLVRPVIVIGELEPTAVIPPGELVTVYETVPLPLYAGSVKETTACPLPATADTPDTTPGSLPDCAPLNPKIGIFTYPVSLQAPY